MAFTVSEGKGIKASITSTTLTAEVVQDVTRLALVVRPVAVPEALRGVGLGVAGEVVDAGVGWIPRLGSWRKIWRSIGKI